MNEIELLKSLPTLKDEMQAFADRVVSSLMDDGEFEPLEIAVRIKAIKKTMELIETDERFMDSCLDHADLYPEKTFEFSGIQITKSQSVRYDYSQDEEWSEIKSQENKIAILRKEREKLLNTIRDMKVIDGNEVYPAVRISKDVLRYKF